MAPWLDYTSGYYKPQAADRKLRVSIGLRFKRQLRFGIEFLIQVNELVATQQHVGQITPRRARTLFAGRSDNLLGDSHFFRVGRPAEQQVKSSLNASGFIHRNLTEQPFR